MSIVLIGGYDRMHDEYKGICSKRGHQVKVFTQKPAKFNKVIGNPDWIVLFTNTVSHVMVQVAQKEAKRKNIPVLRSHCSSGNSLEEALLQLEKVAYGRSI
ncbi:MAG TPA: DUF2325 domain-containing protein [Desulfitobacteriaceae bacterium]|nr:DUF2325 domain-containing protein [Desulfitobacteriaceae bacterium]